MSCITRLCIWGCWLRFPRLPCYIKAAFNSLSAAHTLLLCSHTLPAIHAHTIRPHRNTTGFSPHSACSTYSFYWFHLRLLQRFYYYYYESMVYSNMSWLVSAWSFLNANYPLCAEQSRFSEISCEAVAMGPGKTQKPPFGGFAFHASR